MKKNVLAAVSARNSVDTALITLKKASLTLSLPYVGDVVLAPPSVLEER